jgi:hypothetical protein
VDQVKRRKKQRRKPSTLGDQEVTRRRGGDLSGAVEHPM